MERSRAPRAEQAAGRDEPAPEPLVRVTGAFDSIDCLNDAVDHLVEAHFPSDSIDILTRDCSHALREVPVEQKTRLTAGASIGAATGATIGLTLVTVFPGVALLVGGPLLAALHATAAGTIAGALNGLGWWRAEADVPSHVLESGGALVGIAVPAKRAGDAADALHRAGAKRVDTTA